MIKVEITEIEKKAEIKQGDLLEYLDGDVVLVTDPEGNDAEKDCQGVLIRNCAGEYEIGDYDDIWFKYAEENGQPVKHLKCSFTIEQIDDGKPPKQGDVMVSKGNRDIVMFVSDKEDHRDHFAGVVLRSSGWAAGAYSYYWGNYAFKKLNGSITITQDGCKVEEYEKPIVESLEKHIKELQAQVDDLQSSKAILEVRADRIERRNACLEALNYYDRK